MTELNKSIIKILDKGRVWSSEINAIKEFISKCSLTDFEKIKDLDYDESCENENLVSDTGLINNGWHTMEKNIHQYLNKP